MRVRSIHHALSVLLLSFGLLCLFLCTGCGQGNTMEHLYQMKVLHQETYHDETAEREAQAGVDGGENAQSEHTAVETAPAKLVISEVMASNRASYADCSGRFGDWIEIQNLGETLDLAGFSFSCGRDSWEFPELSLERGNFLVIFCDGTGESAGGELHTGFAISARGEELSLSDCAGRLLDTVPAMEAEEDLSWARDESGSFRQTTLPTPGYANTEEGYVRFQQQQRGTAKGLVISEAMVYNDCFSINGAGYADWIELKNAGNVPVELSDYALSDRGRSRLLWKLPAGTLNPGEYVVYACTTEKTGSGIAPFALNAQAENLYLSRWDGQLCDYALLRQIPRGCSYGRGEDGFYYYERPTPGKENAEGKRFAGVKPILAGEPDVRDGVFDGVEDVVVVLEGPGEIRYTTDGSDPTRESFLYTGPIRVAATCVLRAASYAEGHLRSDTLSLSYILNEKHSLPVVSVVCDPEDFFDPNTGVYYRPYMDLEIPAAVMFYEKKGEESDCFRLDCGLKLHGATSRFVQKKKSLKLNFRGYYGGELQYDLFGRDVQRFSSILLRAAQEGDSSSYMRDALMHEAAIRCFPELPAQDHRYAVLYINGEYRGLYNIREAHSAAHFANHYSQDVKQVKQWHEKWPADGKVEEIYNFAMTHDLRDDANFRRVAEVVDLDSVIAWSIIQAYSGNFDFNSPNMRFYWSEADQKLRFALVDLDLGLFTAVNYPALFSQAGYEYNRLAGRLMTNERFRQVFCKRFYDSLTGEMSDKNMLAMVDSFADEIEQEIAREKQRWGGKPADWNALVENIRTYITKENGRAKKLVTLLVNQKVISVEEGKTYFGELYG